MLQVCVEAEDGSGSVLASRAPPDNRYSSVLTYADVCWRMLTYAGVC